MLVRRIPQRLVRRIPQRPVRRIPQRYRVRPSKLLEASRCPRPYSATTSIPCRSEPLSQSKQETFKSEAHRPEPPVAPPTTVVPLHLRPFDGHDDVLSPVAKLASVERRIGYQFSDKLLGITALNASNGSFKFNLAGTERSVDSFKRLALLGDRILNSALCQSWYESGQSTSKSISHLLNGVPY